MSAIKTISGDVLRVEEGAIYPALRRMEETGWIRAQWVTKENGRRARIYEISAVGTKQLGDGQGRFAFAAQVFVEGGEPGCLPAPRNPSASARSREST